MESFLRRAEPHLLEGWRGVIFRTDWLSPLVMAVICGYGCASIYSATANPDSGDPSLWEKQLIYIAAGFVAYAGVAMIDYGKLRRHALAIWWLGLIPLLPLAICAVVKHDLPPFVRTVNFARRWIDLGPITIQPSEFAKISTLVMIAATLAGVRSWSVKDTPAPAPPGSESAARRLFVKALLVPARLFAYLSLLASPVLAPVFFLRYGSHWDRELNAFSTGLMRVDTRVLAARIAGWPGTRVAFAALPPIGLIFIQPDLKSCIVFLPMLAGLLFVARLPLRIFAGAAIFAAIFGGALVADISAYAAHLQKYRDDPALVAKLADYREEHKGAKKLAFPKEVFALDPYQTRSPLFFIRDYQRERVVSFIDPELIDRKGSGSTWNVKQAMIAVGRGGLRGAGWMSGSQARLGYLPSLAAHNDFVFSVFAEEFGFVGTALLISGYAFLILSALRTGFRARDRFGSLLCVGAAIILSVHVVVNIGMNIGFMPVSGLPLPFLSYGGSFVVSCFLLLGLVQSVHRYSRELPPRQDPEIRTVALADRGEPARGG